VVVLGAHRLDKFRQGDGVQPHLLFVNPLLKQFGRVFRKHWYAGFRKMSAVVIEVIHKMNCATRFTLACGQDGSVHVHAIHAGATKVRQQARMDIQDAPFPNRWNHQFFQPPAQANQGGSGSLNLFEASRRVGGIVFEIIPRKGYHR